jgi:membrane-bound lytic murein transglycosylase D
MQDYLQSHGSYLQKMKSSSRNYFNLIDNIFTQYGLPKELKYLAVIESNLKSQALSWVGARGPWQFMSYTAKDYGLLVNRFTDERTDYYKSTNAAARYLLALYKDLKDWLLVIAAYNGGPGRVYTAIKKSGSRNFWSLQYYLPTESRNHVKKFIATHYIMEANSGSPDFNYEGLNSTGTSSNTLSNLKEVDIRSTEILTISGKYNSAIIAKNLDIDINEFNRLNPSLDVMLASGNSYDLRLAPDKLDSFVANKYLILNECVQALLNDVSLPTKTIYNRHTLKNSMK